MPKPFPKEPKEQHEFLAQQAEGYTRRTKVTPRSLMQWRNRALDWIKQNAPNSDLSDAVFAASSLASVLSLKPMSRQFLKVFSPSSSILAHQKHRNFQHSFR